MRVYSDHDYDNGHGDGNGFGATESIDEEA